MEEKTVFKNSSARSSHRRCSISEKMFLEIWQNSQENIRVCNFIEKETLPQMFSCEFCIFYTFFTEHLPATASAVGKNMILRPILFLK